jgi:hypothetical protein
MLRVLRSKTLNINSVADLNDNSCGTLPTFFSIYLLTFKTVSTSICYLICDPYERSSFNKPFVKSLNDGGFPRR